MNKTITTNLLGYKCGMSSIVKGDCIIPVTILTVPNNIVAQVKTLQKDNYQSIQIGIPVVNGRTPNNKPLKCHLHKAGAQDAEVKHHLRETLVHTDHSYQAGELLDLSIIKDASHVSVQSLSKGKGFQGAMKKWNFKGMPATHGTSLSHRALGSTGQCQDPGRVFKGKKMAGRMGAERVTTQNMRIVKIDRGLNLLYVKGAVPGQNGGFVEIKDAVKKPLFGTDKVEDKSIFPPLPTFEYEDGIDGCGESHETMMPQQQEDPFDPDSEEAA